MLRYRDSRDSSIKCEMLLEAFLTWNSAISSFQCEINWELIKDVKIDDFWELGMR